MLACRRSLVPLLALAATLVPAADASAAAPAYVVDRAAAKIYELDPATGIKTLFADGDDINDPNGIAIEPSGDLVISDAGFGGVIRLDREDGDQTPLAQNADFGTPEGIAVAADGTILVADSGAGGVLDGRLFNAGAVIAVDPADGTTWVVTGDGALEEPRGLAGIGADVLVADAAGPGPTGSLLRVSDTAQTTVASGGQLQSPNGVAREPGGTLLVTDARGASAGAILRVTGSSPVEITGGGSLVDPRGIALEPDGGALVADPGAGQVIRITPAGAQVPLATSFTRPVAVAIPADRDADGVADLDDTCPAVANAAQTDTDADGLGDACDVDDDNDGISDADEVRAGTNPLHADSDGDGVDDRTDTYPLVFTTSQVDTDGDGLGNRCDPTPGGDHQPAAKADGSPAAAPAFMPRLQPPGLAADPVPQPVVAQEVGATPKSGTVRVRRPGTSEYVTLEGGEIPVGAVVDTTRGAVVLTAAQPDGSVQSASFTGGTFRVAQSADGVTDLFLTGGVPGCPRAARGLRLGRVATAARHQPSGSPKRRSRLWGDGHGHFRTHGRNAVATVRGTKWLVEERCAGTLVRVARGVVAVRDRRTRKTTLVRRGEQVLVRR